MLQRIKSVKLHVCSLGHAILKIIRTVTVTDTPATGP